MASEPVDPKHVGLSEGYDQGQQMTYPGQNVTPQAPPYTAQPMAYNHQQPISMQPVAPTTTNTTIVINQPSAPQVGQWSSGICSCFDDCESCVIGCLCPQAVACMVASQLNEDCCCCIGCTVGGAYGMRVRVRTMYNIHGSICQDSSTTACCYPCVVCQLRRELKTRGVH